MKIEILGTRAKIEAFAPKHKNHSGFLIDDKILIDVGEAEFLNKDPEAIIFTHFHPDHAFFVAKQEIFKSKIPHFGPEAHELIPQLKVITETFEIEGYKFTPLPVIHALRLKSLAYLVEKDEKKIFFTGDVAWIEKAHLQTFPKVDCIFTEATFIKKGGRINRKNDKIFGHTGVPDLIRIFKPYTDKICFTHFGNWFMADPEKGKAAIKAQESEEIDLIPGEDGMVLKV